MLVSNENINTGGGIEVVVSLALTGKHNIFVDKHNKLTVEGTKISIKDIPFIRYRFNEYGDEEFDYIIKMKEKFRYSSHLAEMPLAEWNVDLINRLEDINVAKYVYVDVTDDVVQNGFDARTLELVEELNNCRVDRVILKDKSTTLDTMASIRLMKQLMTVSVFELEDYGICSSPLSFSNGRACMPAVRARDLAANYAEHDEVALPTENHECMESCGCIKYIVIDGDIKDSMSQGAKANGKGSKEVKDTSDKKSKAQNNKKSSFLKW